MPSSVSRQQVPDLGARRRIVGAERTVVAARLRVAYETGSSIRDLARATGRSYGFVHRVLTGAGVTLRHRGGRPRPDQARQTGQP